MRGAWSEPQPKDDAVLDVTSSPVYTVTKTADLSDGTCNADCSLREAIGAANAAPAAVLVPKGTYRLAGAAGDDANTSGDPRRARGLQHLRRRSGPTATSTRRVGTAT